MGHLLDVACDEHIKAGGRAQTVHDVARAGYLFRFVQQTAVFTARYELNIELQFMSV
jgi:hypothetical protein